MDYQALAAYLFPHITTTPDQIEARYPARDLKEGAKVTRMAPSPTGFMHLGNLYGALVDERLAHQSDGVFYLRIEDTDQKREVPGGVKTILEVFQRFGLPFDEGATLEGDNGIYGPYRQRQRAEIYQTFAKDLVARGLAYPDFSTEEELAEMRKLQEERKENFGYYGEYAVGRKLTFDQIKEKVEAGIPYVIRFRSPGDPSKKVYHTDLVKGKMEMPENDQDVVLLKSDGIPTYHFAHVVDDHLMGTTHVVRGEEWLATLPIHLQLFDTMGWKRPKYIHTAQLMKMDGGSKRKLSKRKDPELALDYYYEAGVPVPAVLEYLMILLNSNFEEWRMANPMADRNTFPFNTKKMSGSGALFDIDKLADVSRNVISRMSADEVYDYVIKWAQDFDPELKDALANDPDYAKAILAIGRGGKKPRKDIGSWKDVRGYIGFFYDQFFTPDYARMPDKDPAVIRDILLDYAGQYDETEDAQAWFERVKNMCPKYGYTANMKEYKQDPEAFKGNVADLSTMLRVAVTGRDNSPELEVVMKLLGKDRVIDRLKKAAEAMG